MGCYNFFFFLGGGGRSCLVHSRLRLRLGIVLGVGYSQI